MSVNMSARWTRRDPVDWGIHLYHAIKYESPQTLDEFRSLLPDPSADHVWFTELGAYYCEFGRSARGRRAS